MGSKRSGDYLDQTRQLKSHRHSSPEMNDNSTDSAGAIHFENTELDNVFTADNVPNIIEAQIALEDDKEPIIIVICKGMRDKFMSFVTNLERGFPTTNTETTNTNPPPTARDRETVNFDFEAVDKLTEMFENTVTNLNAIQYTFKEEELTQDCEDNTKLREFRLIRKTLTDLYVFGNKTINMTKNVRNGTNDYLIRNTYDIIPNRLSQHFMQDLQENLKTNTITANCKMFNKTVESCTFVIQDFIHRIPEINRKILAKSWRTVKRNKRDIGRTNFRDNRNTREYPPRYNIYNPDRQHQTHRNDRQEYTRRPAPDYKHSTSIYHRNENQRDSYSRYHEEAQRRDHEYRQERNRHREYREPEPRYDRHYSQQSRTYYRRSQHSLTDHDNYRDRYHTRDRQDRRYSRQQQENYDRHFPTLPNQHHNREYRRSLNP